MPHEKPLEAILKEKKGFKLAVWIKKYLYIDQRVRKRRAK